MLLFGLTGTLAEAGTFGLQHLAEVGLRVFAQSVTRHWMLDAR
jgi:hypothetical protein